MPAHASSHEDASSKIARSFAPPAAAPREPREPRTAALLTSAPMIVALTPDALERLLAGDLGAHELALSGELRTFSRAHRLHGSAVRVPDRREAVVCPLPEPFDLLNALFPRSLASPATS